MHGGRDGGGDGDFTDTATSLTNTSTAFPRASRGDNLKIEARSAARSTSPAPETTDAAADNVPAEITRECGDDDIALDPIETSIWYRPDIVRFMTSRKLPSFAMTDTGPTRDTEHRILVISDSVAGAATTLL
jgi:hypothetical protein